MYLSIKIRGYYRIYMLISLIERILIFGLIVLLILLMGLNITVSHTFVDGYNILEEKYQKCKIIKESRNVYYFLCFYVFILP